MTQEEKTKIEERIVDVLKTVYEIIILPLTNICVNRLKRIEGTEVYDTNISYNPFKIRDL